METEPHGNKNPTVRRKNCTTMSTFFNQHKKPSVTSLQLIFRALPHPNKNFQKKDIKKEILYVVF
jgi:hypothetical protein